MSKFQSFLEENKVLLYCWFLWICLHVILWVADVGYRSHGFWPFNAHEYGFLEFFVYVIVLPAVILIIKDINDNGWANRR